MPTIRPISDLRNKFTEISVIVHEEGHPVFLTRQGVGDMVVMSIEQYEDLTWQRETTEALAAADIELASTTERYTTEDVLADLERIISQHAHTSTDHVA